MHAEIFLLLHPPVFFEYTQIFSTNSYGKALCFPSIAKKSAVSMAFNHSIPVSSFLLFHKE